MSDTEILMKVKGWCNESIDYFENVDLTRYCEVSKVRTLLIDEFDRILRMIDKLEKK